MKVLIINLKSTKDRWDEFLRRNTNALLDCDIKRIEGIDSREIINMDLKSKLISSSAIEGWTAGAIGAALSHMYCWRVCIKSGEPLVIMEDDVILARNWYKTLMKLLNQSSKMVLLGWNLDSMLQATMFENQEIISLFEPAYPDENHISKLVNSKEPRQSINLSHCFGLPAYWIIPSTAQELLKLIKPLAIKEIKFKRGIPTCYSTGIDGLLNLFYTTVGAKITVPPLAIATNEQSRSLTRFRG